jgi:hypothetical protein
MKPVSKKDQTSTSKKSAGSSKDELKTDAPLSEKDEVKNAEDRLKKGKKQA